MRRGPHKLRRLGTEQRRSAETKTQPAKTKSAVSAYCEVVSVRVAYLRGAHKRLPSARAKLTSVCTIYSESSRIQRVLASGPKNEPITISRTKIGITPIKLDVLKRDAKKARKVDPTLTHAQHLDRLSRERHGARDFHDLRNRVAIVSASHNQHPICSDFREGVNQLITLDEATWGESSDVRPGLSD